MECYQPFVYTAYDRSRYKSMARDAYQRWDSRQYLLIVWFALVWLVLSNPELKTLLQTIQPTVLIAMALCGVLLLISQIYEMARKYTLQTERGYSFDTDHG